MNASFLHSPSPQFGDSQGLVEWSTHPIFPPFLFHSPFPPLLAPGSQVSNPPWSRALLPLDPRIGAWKANPRINSNLSTTIANYPTWNKLLNLGVPSFPYLSLFSLPYVKCRQQVIRKKIQPLPLRGMCQ